ncbi:phenol hydroxylase subunit P4 [Moraxella canis]|uniref:Phenol hydroxylase subunit P4 n=1 Tax=Moraxella canis TaxID=90239 RepID=A0ABZ0WWX3_9GAMM|nr:phenol hydroxylase subunit P4 [Moraxella canis]WQE03747.1 phenol hydroxylase subunit P4 [Moraxella canis]
MPVKAINDNYRFTPRDTQANYGDNLLIYIGWDHHLLFCSAKAFLISPKATFQELLDTLMPAGFSQHPDFANIDWAAAKFMLDNQYITPNLNETLESIGFAHKSLLRFKTPLSASAGTAKV